MSEASRPMTEAERRFVELIVARLVDPALGKIDTAALWAEASGQPGAYVEVVKTLALPAVRDAIGEGVREGMLAKQAWFLRGMLRLGQKMLVRRGIQLPDNLDSLSLPEIREWMELNLPEDPRSSEPDRRSPPLGEAP